MNPFCKANKYIPDHVHIMDISDADLAKLKAGFNENETAMASWDLSISDADFKKLKVGFLSQQMEDKWNIITADLGRSGKKSVHISRSWTGIEHYVIVIKPGDGHSGAKIKGIIWKAEQGDRISEEQAKKMAIYLCRALLEGDFESALDFGP
ncbi:hypothetical protein B0H63DRAFT_164513 [Podospora didyma]|uniref:Uncharacterized protein n=1 Tax=Podospora didyma TaxID=330526 RepID=A0AAE0NU77_9PEZI|nr:hypothetical protein B0H63DRAFT_164513 [Podospora didyma]